MKTGKTEFNLSAIAEMSFEEFCSSHKGLNVTFLWSELQKKISKKSEVLDVELASKKKKKNK